jgi:hypothetical protein
MQPLPRDVQMALELLSADPAREGSIDKRAATAGVSAARAGNISADFFAAPPSRCVETCAWGVRAATCCERCRHVLAPHAFSAATSMPEKAAAVFQAGFVFA